MPLVNLQRFGSLRLLGALLPVPHGALFNHRMGNCRKFALLSADIA